jgi:hypothetical protein
MLIMRGLVIILIVHVIMIFPRHIIDESVVRDIVKMNITFTEIQEINELVQQEKPVASKYENMLVLIPRDDKQRELSPLLSNDFLGFKEAIGFRESSGHYDKVNKFGYIGKYQFGRAAMSDIGIYDKKIFLNSPILQERAFIALCSLNKYKLRNYIGKYDGKTVNGIELTESGMLAAAHLVGPGAVIDYIKSNGKNVRVDGLGTEITEYLEAFKGYDVSVITPSRKVRVSIS